MVSAKGSVSIISENALVTPQNSIYILLTKFDTIISKIIALFTNDKYTHAAIAFDADLHDVYSFSRKYVNFPLPAGLRTEPLNKGIYKINEQMSCALFRIQVDSDSYNRARHEVKKMMRHRKRFEYNIIGLFLCKLGIAYKRRRHYFCSEFVATILTDSNALCLPKVPSLMRPNDYTQMPELECVYIGELRCLRKYLEGCHAL